MKNNNLNKVGNWRIYFDKMTGKLKSVYDHLLFHGIKTEAETYNLRTSYRYGLDTPHVSDLGKV